MKERAWVESPVFPDRYLVSSDGRVFSIVSAKELKPHFDRGGYVYYVLRSCGVGKTVKAHRLVAIAFIPNPMNKPAVDHIDGDPSNNDVSNLRWVTAKENSLNPATLPRLRERAAVNLRKMQRLAVERNFYKKAVLITWADGRVEQTESVKEASERTGVGASRLSQILQGKHKQYRAFTAQYA